MNRVVFLDYDGVVNTYREYDYGNGPELRYGWPSDNVVNNRRAVEILNELYQLYPFDIVVSSSWREESNYKECLYNGGLNPEIKVIGATPTLQWRNRDQEIMKWVNDNDFKGSFVVFDDEPYLFETSSLKLPLVLVSPDYGLSRKSLKKAIRYFRLQEGEI